MAIFWATNSWIRSSLKLLLDEAAPRRESRSESTSRVERPSPGGAFGAHLPESPLAGLAQPLPPRCAWVPPPDIELPQNVRQSGFTGACGACRAAPAIVYTSVLLVHCVDCGNVGSGQIQANTFSLALGPPPQS